MPIPDFLLTNGTSPTRVMCLGDSITEGYDLTSTVLPKTDAWRYRFWYRVRRAGLAVQMVGPYDSGSSYAAWTGHHAGVGGTTLATMNSNVAAWIASHTPDVIILIGGVNDLVSVNVATTKGRLETLLDTINATPTSPHVIVSTTPINSSDSADCIAYNAEISGVASAKGATFVDAGSQIVAGSGLIADNVHPNPRGNEAMATSLSAAYIAWAP